MGHITKRNGRQQATYRDPAGREHTQTFDRVIDARNFLTSIENAKLMGAYVDPASGKVPFRAFAEPWRVRQLHRDGTERSVEQQLRLHVYKVIGDRPIAAVRPSEIDDLVRRLSVSLAPSTVEVIYGRVAAIFAAAVRDRVIASSPCVGVKLPAKGAASNLETLRVEQVHALADAVPDRYRSVVVAGAGLGLRPGELFGLAANRVDFLRRTVRVDQQIARLKGGGVGLSPLKTDSSYRTIPLPTIVADALAARMATWPPHAELGLIFTTSRGGSLQQHTWAEVWATAARRADLPDWATPHDLRHFYASLLIRSGASVKVVQARLGHASAKTTLDIYGHLWEDEEDRTRAAVDEMLSDPADLPRTEQAP